MTEREPVLLFVVGIVALVGSGISPHDRFTIARVHDRELAGLR